MDYCIVNSNGIIDNMIVADESFAAEIDALPCYDGATIGEAYAPPENLPSPAQQREIAYNTETLIEWSGSLITVTEAAAVWQYYAAEGSPDADILQKLISGAKEKIRKKYPDESGVLT